MPVDYTAELKLDGLSVALHYVAANDGGRVSPRHYSRRRPNRRRRHLQHPHHSQRAPQHLRRASSRRPLPQAIEMRGEVVMPEAAFLRVNEEREREGLPVFVNPRNSAAGTIRTLDPTIVANRPLVSSRTSCSSRANTSPPVKRHPRRPHRPRLSREPPSRPRAHRRRHDSSS